MTTMSHIALRKMVGGRYGFAGRQWWYDFSSLPHVLDEAKATKVIGKKSQAFHRLVADWDSHQNSVWLVRMFYSAKMILAASLMLQSLDYSQARDLQVCIPYLRYYSLLYSLKALTLSLPSQPWNDGNLIMQSHTKTINVATDVLKQFDRELGERHRTDVLQMKAIRELISYRAPTSGGAFATAGGDVLGTCKVFAELAQLMSELLEAALIKRVEEGMDFGLDGSVLEAMFLIKIGDESFHDDEDRYRIGYFARKYPMPANILHMMTEGHVEDFWGSWCAKDPTEDMFDPDDNCQILFDVP